MTKNFPQPNSKKSIDAAEKEILKFWKESQIFEKTLSTRNPLNKFNFFDGPPFATGLPHYGHILAGTIKDAIPRYKTMCGYHIPRKWGWDCHGVPVEFQVEKKHKIGGKPGIEKMGVGKFNELCRSVVMKCASDWRQTVDRMGRFVDFKNDYRTMDPEFMESVWWVFAKLWDKGLIYEGEKVIAYSPKLGSPLSNFEANLNYKPISDPAVTVKFKIIENSNNFPLDKGGEGGCSLERSEEGYVWNKNFKFLPYKKELTEKARENRKNPTEPEKKVWEILARKNFAGFKFTKQKPIGSYIVDFYCAELGLVIEIDGDSHVQQKEYDKNRTEYLNTLGLEVIRYTNDETMKNLEGVYGDLEKKIKSREKFLAGLSAENPPQSPLVKGEVDSPTKKTEQKNIKSNEKILTSTPSNSPLSEGKPDTSATKIREEDIGNPDTSPLTRGLGGCYLLAWTTTPWTLPSNLALCVNEKLEYVKVKQDGEFFIVGKNLAGKIFGEDVEIIEKIAGSELKGLEYEPLFPFFKDHENAFRILSDDFVSDSDGTGIVHMAPNFGEEDARVCQLNGVKYLSPNPIDENGYFDLEYLFPVPSEKRKILEKDAKEIDAIPAIISGKAPLTEITELDGLYFRADAEVAGSKEENANKWVLENLGDKIFKKESITHDYPFCWRTDCALMYRGIKTWFVDIQKIKAQMIEKNQDINWVPAHLKAGRFGKTLETAPDWAISRNRYWGCPMPVWRCENEDCGHIEVVNSREFLEKKCGQKVEDLHKHFVDDLSWDCEKCAKKMVRIEEVLDCWFESGSMPYASVHYPFENKEISRDFASADFIAEGLDQTRGWFYTLHVLGCALFGKNIFKNVITNGIILAEDGQKMSKSKKNYPDPNLVFEKYGADAMRYYLLNSPVVRGENFRFAEAGVAEVLKQLILPLKSSYQFFSTYANIDGWKPTKIQIIRHGEGDHNVQNIYSGKVENAHHLTEKGKEQVRNSAKNLAKFDVLISSPFIRAQETAKVVKDSAKFEGEIIVDDRVRENDFGNFEGREIVKGIFRLDNPEYSGGETVPELRDRMTSFFADISRDFRGKTITVCGHGCSFRQAEMVVGAIPAKNEEWKLIPLPQTAGHKLFFPTPQTDNELDKWILSELQVLVENFRENFDKYALDAALQNIPKFIDKLNNWYLRRSRERFWANGMSDDKISGYETLFQVLLTLSKVLAPVCPFFAEELFKNLTDGESVHLEMMPFSNKKLVDNTLNKKIEISREIVRLAAFIRGNKKIKLRQPLAKLQFAIETSENVELSEADLAVIKSEANVHEVEIISREILAKYAKRIVKVQAKKVGRKFGKKVQELIINGKKGDFRTLENGEIEISGEILVAGEYEYGFLTQDGVEAEATSEVVVLLDAEITDELKIEGFSREIIRSIQDLRKSYGFEIADRIKVEYSTKSEELNAAFGKFREKIAGETLATAITENSSLDSDEIEVGGEKCVLKLEKV